MLTPTTTEKRVTMHRNRWKLWKTNHNSAIMRPSLSLCSLTLWWVARRIQQPNLDTLALSGFKYIILCVWWWGWMDVMTMRPWRLCCYLQLRVKCKWINRRIKTHGGETEGLLNKKWSGINLKSTLWKHVSSYIHRRGPECLIAMGTPWGRGQGQPNGRWLRGHWILSRLIFSPPGSLWKSRRGLFSSMLSRWGHVEPEMPNCCPQRGSIRTLGNETLLRGGCKFQAAQTFVAWVSTVQINGDFSEEKNVNWMAKSTCVCCWVDISRTTDASSSPSSWRGVCFLANDDLFYLFHFSWICP